MQISIEIDNNSVAQKVLWFLKHLKKEGVTILKETDHNLELSELPSQYSDEYIKNNWRTFAYNASGDIDQDDDKLLREKYGKYLNEKHNI